MTRIPAPEGIAAKIAERAVRAAREDVRSRGWKSSAAMQPYSGAGEVGITVTVKHLMFQDVGISPFIMWWVEGRKVPLSCKQGDGPHVRTGRDVGKPGYVNIPHQGRVWRNQKWRHPGIKPQRFMEKAISTAIRDSRNDIRSAIMDILKGTDA